MRITYTLNYICTAA